MILGPVHLPEIGLSLYTMPKIGGTTIRHWVYFLRTGNECEGDAIYEHDWLCQGSIQEESVMVRRDPVDRFISGFRNFRDKRGLALSFSEFLEALPRLIRENANYAHHFRPQSSYYPQISLGDVDHVFDFEDFHLIREFLEDRAGKKLPDYHLQKSRFDNFEVTDEQLELIQQYYVQDYMKGFGDVVDDEVVVNSVDFN